MATKIIPKKSSTAAKVPLATDLEVGEIAINLTDQKLYSKNASNEVVEIGGGGGASFMRKDQSNTVTGSFAIAGSFGNIMSTDGYDAFLYSEGSQKLRTWNSGILVSGTATANDFNTTSDARLKENVSTLDNALDKVLAMRGVEFDWKETGDHTVGFIAQEVEEVVPELVNTNNEDGIKSVKYGNVTALLVEAIKELQAEVAELKSQLNNK